MNKPIPFQITFRDFAPSEAVRFVIEGHIERLEEFNARATSCEVIVSLPHKHPHKAAIYHIEVLLHVPGETLVATREPERNYAHTDIYVAIHDAFDAIERRLECFLQKRRGFVKSPNVSGTVSWKNERQRDIPEELVSEYEYLEEIG